MSELIRLPTELPPRITRVTLNMEIERLVRANLKDEDLNRLLSSTDDDNAFTKKYHGDRWLAAAQLKELANEQNGVEYPATCAASILEIRSRLYMTILPRIGQDRKTRLAAYADAKRLADAEAAREDLDHSGE